MSTYSASIFKDLRCTVEAEMNQTQLMFLRISDVVRNLL